MLAPGGNHHRAFFVEGVRGEEGGHCPPLHRGGGGGGGGGAGHPEQYPLAKVCHEEALPWPSMPEHVGIKVPVGIILMMRWGMYGGVATVPLELEGLAQVLEWRQVEEYAALTDFVWLWRMNLVLDDPKKEASKGIRPCH